MRRLPGTLVLGAMGWFVAFGGQRAAMAQTMRNVPLGGRTATMGGAGTATGNDSAMPYVNPAGMAGIPGDIFAVSANLYGYSRRLVPKLSFPNGHQPQLGRYTTTDKTLEASGVTDMPSSIMYFQHIGEPGDDMHHVFGMSLIIPYATSTEMVGSTTLAFARVNGSATENVSVIHNETDYYFGPSYAISFEYGVRLGVSLYALHTRSVKAVQNVSNLSLGGGAVATSTSTGASFEREAWGFVPIVGIQAPLTEELWLGAAVAAPSYPIHGTNFGTADSNSTNADPNNPGATLVANSQRTSEGSYRSARPLRINVGGAWEDRGTFSVAADGYVFFERKEAIEVKEASTFRESASGETTRKYGVNHTPSRDLIQAFGASLGIEVGLTDELALRAGGFSDVSNHPAFRDDDPWLYEVREDRAGGTLGLGLQFDSFDTTLGVVYTHGWGRMKVADSTSSKALEASQRGRTYFPMVDTTFDSVLFVFSGAVTTEEAQEQIRQYAPVPVEVNLPEPSGHPRAPVAPGEYRAPPSPAAVPPPPAAVPPPPAAVPPSAPKPDPAPAPEPPPAPGPDAPGGEP